MKKFMLLGLVSLICGLFGCTSGETSQPTKTDKELFTAYYAELMAKTGEADQLYKPFANALQLGDIIGATQIALQIKLPINSKYNAIHGVTVPSLRNQEAKQKLNEAHEALSNCYLYKSSIVSDFIDYSDSPSVKKMAEMKNSAEGSQAYLLRGMATMIEVADKVGIKPEEFAKLAKK